MTTPAPASPPPLLEVRGLRVAFGGVVAVDDVSFDLHGGEILGVIGPNGAGKTTVFDAISGFVPARGRIILGGVELDGASPERRSRAGLGRSFQDARLFPSLTVSEALAVAFERHIRVQDPVSTALSLPWVRTAERRIRRRVDDLIELMGLAAFRDKFVSELSTGSRRIVDLAVILAHEPTVLLLDEPSSGIAQRETEALGPMLLRVREQTGASLIVIEHDMPLIRSVSDRLLALDLGAVLAEGPTDEVLEDPRLVAAYLGTDRAVVERSGSAGGNGATPHQPASAAVPERASAEKGPPARRAPARKRAAPKKAAGPKKAAVRKKAATKKSAAKKRAVKKKAAVKKRAPVEKRAGVRKKKAAPRKSAQRRG